MSVLNKFNGIVTVEIQRATNHEKKGEWREAREAWLDIIEYCLLFARKTPELKIGTSRMIIEKAQKLMARVETIDEKIRAERLYSTPHEPTGALNFLSPGPGEEPPKEAAMVYQANEKQQDLNGQLKAAIEKMEPARKEGSKSSDGKNFIEVGEERIEIPDNFPLIEITPKDSFKPAAVTSERLEIDSTKHYVDGESKADDKIKPGT
nr:hypothetical protein [Candidatus Sigynarchaeota archaeon]